jgi:hypothetical protein
MLINMKEMQLQKFEQLAEKIMAEPEKYCIFDSVSDFYKASWLNDFPKGTTWSATGLDNGADEFYAQIEYKDRYISISSEGTLKVSYGIRK